MKLYSFDIFDTLVSRRVARPIGIFAIMQQRIAEWEELDSTLRRNFPIVRRELERFLIDAHKAKHIAEQVNFGEIYSFFGESYHLDESMQQRLMELEMSVERDNLVAKAESMKLLKSLVDRGERVVLISDMYYSSAELRTLLRDIDPIFETITIYVSSEWGGTKSGRSLYRKVREREGVEYCDWEHWGDNPHSDIAMAKSFGITTHFLPQSVRERYEEEILGRDLANVNLDLEMIIGSAHLASAERTLSASVGKERTNAYKLGRSFTAPIIYGYAEWLIEQAQRMGLGDIYFLSRDGFIVKRIADKILESRGLEIRTHYIYSSRRAWRTFTADDYDEYAKFAINIHRVVLTLGYAAEQLGLEVDDLRKYCNAAPDQRLTQKQANRLLKAVLEDQQIRERVVAQFACRRKELADYLHSVVDFSADKILFVDVNGTGRTMDMMVDVFPDYEGKMYIAFIHLIPTAQLNARCIKMSYLSSYTYRDSVIESFSRTLDGALDCYEIDEQGKISAVLNKSNNERDLKWGYNEYYAGVELYVDNIIELQRINNYRVNSLQYYCHLIPYIKNRVDRNLMNTLGAIPFDVVNSNEVDAQMSKPMTIAEAFTKRFVDRKSAYRQISYGRAPQFVRWLCDTNKRVKRFQKSMFHLSLHRRQNIAVLRILGFKINLHKLLWDQSKL